MTGGGSGGHITPLMSLAHALRKAAPDCRIIYIGLKGEALENHLRDRYSLFDKAYTVPAGKFRRYHGESFLAHITDIRTLALNLRDFFRFIWGTGTAWRLLRRIKPDVVFSKGGFVAVPVGLAARLRKIPIVIHDSDAVPGLANQIIGRYAAVRAAGLPPENDSYNDGSKVFTGVPVDERIKPVTPVMQKAFKEELGLPADCLLLLVGGAGLGARDVNQKVVAAAPKLLERFDKLHIIHIAGDKHEAEVNAQYQAGLGAWRDRITVLDFSQDFYKYAGAADLVITRAGATTIAELALQHKALILIPAPQLAGGHQLKNAEILKQSRAAEVIDNNAAPEKLLKAAETILSSGRRRRELGESLGKLAKADAADKLARLILQAVNRQTAAI